ncbi:hypothetical protein LQV63_31290 [Paenibacillus profundus]|uniref:Uncharacterized protein n=1 Tax=Paenibacillus profundus TaxID=1173085 RepID=A0ABS8YQW4_9BACL|nr:hypothetical protein [Paenibacillus profundus]MCE5173712.1 hypothetical protein [Paenibacillus profundus]
MSNLEELISLLWGCEIISYKFDFENHTLALGVRRVYGEEITYFNVMLEEVCAFSWVNGMGKERKKLYNWEYIDLVSFELMSATNIHILGDDFLSQYSSSPNICMEIGDSILLVEARYLSINNEKFDLLGE